MNTMVGLEASLHTSVGEEISELMKNEKELDVEGEFDDEPEALDADDVDFDPEELLKSPLFNTSTDKLSTSISNENSFGTFHDDIDDTPEPQIEPTCTVGGAGEYQGSSGDFTQHRSYNVLKQQPQRLYSSPTRTISSDPNFADASYEPQPQVQSSPAKQAGDVVERSSFASQQAMSPVQGTPSVTESFPVTSSANQMNFQVQHDPYQQPQQENYQQQEPQQAFGLQGDQMPMQMNQSVSPYAMQGSPTRSASFHSPSGSFPARSPGASSSAYGQLQSSSHHQRSNFGSPSRNGSHSTNMSQQEMGSMNDLQQMQSYVQRMQPRHNNASLSQTVHGEPTRRSSSSSGLGQSLSHSMHERTSFGRMQAHGNVSIASDVQANKSEMDMSTNSASAPGPAPINEAMEKLCESMKRSAMSRSLVKQFSGRNLSRQNSGRLSLSRQNSGRLNRSVMRQNSARSVVEDGSGRGTPTAAVPIRRMSNTKHHLQHPSRGIYRHDSQQSLNGHSNHGISLHIDGRNMGTL